MTTFLVRGTAVTQGSKKAIPMANGKVAMVESAGPRLTQWRHAINTEARHHWAGPPTKGPVMVVAVFTVTRPKSAPKRRWPTQRGLDIDKAARAVLDALTGVCYVDDSQVIKLDVFKECGDTPGVIVTVAPYEAEGAA